MTIKDIAKICGVGVSTVSRVLNNRPDVSEEVRERVLSVVKESGYIPNNSARDLVRSRSDAIGVVVRGAGNVFFAEVLKYVSSELDIKGFTMVPRFIETDADELTAGAELEREKKLRALIFLGGRFNYSPEELAIINVPFVCCSYANTFGSLPMEKYGSVTIDDSKTTGDAVEELIKLGHRDIAAFFNDISDKSISELRYRGYVEALERSGIEPKPALTVETGGFDMPSAYEAMSSLIESGRHFTAAFVSSDEMALAAIKALRDKGLSVPEDCSVIAIDGLKLSEYSVPTLSTMVQPAEEIGRESVRILASVLKGQEVKLHIRPLASLRRGESIAPPRNLRA